MGEHLDEPRVFHPGTSTTRSPGAVQLVGEPGKTGHWASKQWQPHAKAPLSSEDGAFACSHSGKSYVAAKLDEVGIHAEIH